MHELQPEKPELGQPRPIRSLVSMPFVKETRAHLCRYDPIVSGWALAIRAAYCVTVAIHRGYRNITNID